MTPFQEKDKKKPRQNPAKPQDGGSEVSPSLDSSEGRVEGGRVRQEKLDLKITPEQISDLGDTTPHPSKEGQAEEIPAHEAEAMMNRTVVESSCKLVGNLIENITGYPQMNWTEDELKTLVDLWSPIMPTFSPFVAALIGTSAIVGGKVTTLIVMKRAETKERAGRD